jgi:hypothetical protein
VKSKRRKRNELKGYAFHAWTTKFGRCLAPGNKCRAEPIRAHSVQREGPLRRVSANGHVIMLRQRIDLDHGPTYDFASVGVNKATVFTGLCGKHDEDLFRAIDRSQLDVSNKEQLFLYAYRAVLRETHVSIESAAKLQAVYLHKCRIGLDDPSASTRSGMFATERMILAYETWLYKERHDEILEANQLSALVYDCLDLGRTYPCIAVSSLFSLDEVEVEDDVARVALTVLHTETGHSHALFAYLRRDAEEARRWLKPILEHPSIGSRRYLLSRLVLERCDNVAINPALFGQWSVEKRDVVKGFWTSTILRNNAEFNDVRLNLFDASA